MFLRSGSEQDRQDWLSFVKQIAVSVGGAGAGAVAGGGGAPAAAAAGGAPVAAAVIPEAVPPAPAPAPAPAADDGVGFDF